MINQATLPAYLTPSEVAKLLLVSPVTVRQWAQKGWLKAELTGGGHRRFLRYEVERFAFERGLTLHAQSSDELRVLIVDDDRQFSNYLLELLSIENGVKAVEVAHDGFEAGLKVPNFNPNIILLDLMMPGMDGFTVCRHLKEQPATRAIRILAMSGYLTDENRQ
ncbi:MAG: response regulator, partial [Thiotrichaceae bacterium]|nr:response regulator [Thiotrichaceae bacterium]